MKTANHWFSVAIRADGFGGIIYYSVLLVSVILTLFEGCRLESVGHPILIAAAFLGVICTVVTTIYQTEGNSALRATQLSDALGAGTGEVSRPSYYNNALPQSFLRLAATTLENTLFTGTILSRMAVKVRVQTCIYFVLLLIFSTSRETPTSWLLILAQTIFSADLLLKFVRLERFRVRTSRVRERLEQFFLQAGGAVNPNDLALLVGAFTDYECAKDEAAFPLDGKHFKKINSEISKEWDELQTRLKLK